MPLRMLRIPPPTARRLPHADVLFLSPPWGGPQYLEAAVFDLDAPLVGGLSTAGLLRLGLGLADGVVAFLPRNTDPEALAAALGGGVAVEVEANFLNGKLKTVTVYLGASAGRWGAAGGDDDDEGVA